jgi:hypothetical protein
MDRSCAARHCGSFYHILVLDWKTWAARDLNLTFILATCRKQPPPKG